MLLLLRALNLLSPFPSCKYFFCSFPILFIHVICAFFGLLLNLFTATIGNELIVQNREKEFIMFGVSFAMIFGIENVSKGEKPNNI